MISINKIIKLDPKRTKEIKESQEGPVVINIKGKECFEQSTMSKILQFGQDNDFNVSIIFNNKEFDNFSEEGMKQIHFLKKSLVRYINA